VNVKLTSDIMWMQVSIASVLSRINTEGSYMQSQSGHPWESVFSSGVSGEVKMHGPPVISEKPAP
jgi:hypothetical protein